MLFSKLEKPTPRFWYWNDISCYQIWIREGRAGKIKDKEVKEETAVNSTECCLLLNIYDGTEGVNTENFATHVPSPESFRRQSHFPTCTVFWPTLGFSFREFPPLSANPSTRIQSRYTVASPYNETLYTGTSLSRMNLQKIYIPPHINGPRYIRNFFSNQAITNERT